MSELSKMFARWRQISDYKAPTFFARQTIFWFSLLLSLSLSLIFAPSLSWFLSHILTSCLFPSFLSLSLRSLSHNNCASVFSPTLERFFKIFISSYLTKLTIYLSPTWFTIHFGISVVDLCCYNGGTIKSCAVILALKRMSQREFGSEFFHLGWSVCRF